MDKTSFLKKLFAPVDLTKGKPWKVILLFGAPIILSYLLQQIYVLTDAIICGQVLSANEVAGINDTFPLTFIFLQFAFGSTAGFSVITAQHVGSKDISKVRKSFVTQIYLTIIISVILTVLSICLLPWMLSIINITPTNKEVYNAAYIYCLIIFIGIFAQMGYNFVCGILRSYGDSLTPLIFLLISTLLNVGLDLLFLAVFNMGPAGAAIATILAQFISFIACFVYTLIKYKELRFKKEDYKFDLENINKHLKEGIPLGLQFSILAIGIIVMQSSVVKFDLTDTGFMVEGTPAQNGFGAANKLINFLMSIYNGLGSAILGFNAQNYGKKDYKRVKEGTIQTAIIMLIMYAFCLTVGLLLTINGAYQYIFMSADKISDASIKFGNMFVYIDIVLNVFVGFLIVARSAVQGISKSKYVLGAGFAELIARILICAFLPVIINHGPINSSSSMLAFAAVCIGDPGAWIMACIVLIIPTIKYIYNQNYEQKEKDYINSPKSLKKRFRTQN